MLLGAVEGDIAKLGADAGLDAQAVECGQSVLQSYAELSDETGMVELFLILVHREMLVPKAAAEVPDAPLAVAVAGDGDFPRASQYLLVERVGNDFPNGMECIPVFKHPVDVQVKFLHCYARSASTDAQ